MILPIFFGLFMFYFNTKIETYVNYVHAMEVILLWPSYSARFSMKTAKGYPAIHMAFDLYRLPQRIFSHVLARRDAPCFPLAGRIATFSPALKRKDIFNRRVWEVPTDIRWLSEVLYHDGQVWHYIGIYPVIHVGSLTMVTFVRAYSRLWSEWKDRWWRNSM